MTAGSDSGTEKTSGKCDRTPDCIRKSGHLPPCVPRKPGKKMDAIGVWFDGS